MVKIGKKGTKCPKKLPIFHKKREKFNKFEYSSNVLREVFRNFGDFYTKNHALRSVFRHRQRNLERSLFKTSDWVELFLAFSDAIVKL